VNPLVRVALFACLAVACASSAGVAPAPRDGAVLAPVDVPVDPLDDPMTRVECPPGRPDPCGPGRHCIAVGPGFLGVCVRDGARGGLCRLSTLACDEEIPCVDMWCEQNNHFGPRTRCGARFCGLNEGCVELDGALGCVTFGGPGGYCRQFGPPCEPGFQCDDRGNNRSRCVRPIPVGGQCSVAAAGVDVCEGGAACVLEGAGAVCRAVGTERAPCRANATCDPGLECQLPAGATSTLCLRPVLQDQRCDVISVGAPRCAGGLSCALRDGATVGVCRPDGSLLANCRERAPQCDLDLRCHPAFRVCSAILREGAACSPSTNGSVCVEGASCMNSANGLRCLVDGAAGGQCRLREQPCDPGLRCEFRATPPTCLAP
jgi:hypothetical protein